MTTPDFEVKPTPRPARKPKPAGTFNLSGGPLLPHTAMPTPGAGANHPLAGTQNGVSHIPVPQTRSPAANTNPTQFGKHRASVGKHAKPSVVGNPNYKATHAAPTQFGQKGKHATLSPQNTNKVTGMGQYSKSVHHVGKHTPQGQALMNNKIYIPQLQAAATSLHNRQQAAAKAKKKQQDTRKAKAHNVVKGIHEIVKAVSGGKHYMEHVRPMETKFK